ncbi:hypothetical protein [Ilumatobacter sp.]|uniref:hypothetical protein n=1 Tax=Ilumatobacter sp. TaxID=1967498 RepID=UPI003F6CBA1E
MPLPMLRERLRRRPLWVGVSVWLLGALWFFRDPVFSGFDTITGDRGDARLIIFLHEHWWRVLHGEASWRSPDMFAPARDTLGYSDTFALDIVLYAPLRLVGFDQFVAFQLTLVALTAVGFASLFTLMHRYLGLNLLPTCLLALAGVFANNIFIDTGHPQIYAINIVSLVVLVFTAAWRVSDVRWRLAGSAVGGMLVGLLLWSTYYFGWYTVFLGALFVLILTAVVAVQDGLGVVWRTICSRWAMGAASLGGLTVGLVPFFATYLAVLDDSDFRTYDDVAGLAPRPLDLINVGRHNVMWGWLIEPLLDGDGRLDALNRAVAPTPLLLITSAICTVALIRLVAVRASARSGALSRRDGVARIGAALGVATAIAVVSPIQFEFGGAWAWLHRFVPGASALRLFGRIEIVASMLACLTIACWMSARGDEVHAEDSTPTVDGEEIDHGQRRSLASVVIVLIGLVCLEQLNTATISRQFDRSDQLAMLASVGPPPEQCEIFYVTDAELEDVNISIVSAMLIAHEIDLPTMNGYSGQYPPGWDLGPGSVDYLAKVDAWIAERLPEVGTCSLELSTQTWSE